MPLRVAGIYAASASAWIVLSDLTMAMGMGSSAAELWGNVGKGLLFVAASTGLIYLLLRQGLDRETAIRRDLTDQQERFHTAVAQLPFTFAIYDGDRRFRFLNAHGLVEAGKPFAEVVGRRDEEVFPLEWVNAYGPVLNRAFETRQPQTEVVDITLPSGHRHLAYSFTPLLNADGTVREVLAVTNDMTAVVRNDRHVRRLNRTLTAISAANSVLVRSTSEAELLQGFCDVLVSLTGHRLVWVALVTPPDPVLRVAAHAGQAAEYLHGIEIRSDDTPPGHGPTGTCIRSGVPVVCHDFRTDEQMVPWRERAAHCGMRSSVALPLRTAEGVLGALTLYSGEANRFDAEEVKLLEELASDLAYGLAAQRSQLQLQHALAELQASGEQLRLLKQVVEQSAVIAYVSRPGPDWAVDFVSENVSRYGYQAVEFTSGQRPLPSVVHPADWPELVAGTESHLAAGTKEYSLEYRILDAQGGLHWMRDTCTVVRSADGLPKQFRGVLTDITERKQAEELRRDLERLVQGTLDAMTDHICVLEADGTIAYVNEGWRRFATANPPLPEHAGVGGNYFTACAHAERTPMGAEAAKFLAGAQAVLRGEQPEFRMEYACHSPTEQRWFVVRVTPFAPGERPRAVVAHTNITTRKLADFALRESEELLRSVLAEQTEIISRFQPDGTLVFVNSAFCRFFGKSPDELIGQRWQPCSAAEDLAMIEAKLATLTPASPSVTIENRVLNAAGEVRWVQFANRGIFSLTGGLMETQSVGRDVTERKLAEDALRASEEKFRAYVEQAADAVFVHDYSGRLLDVNQRACESLGYNRSELLRLSVPDVEMDFDLARAQAEIQRISSGESGTLVGRHRRKDGTSFPVELRVGCFKVNGETCYLALARDITQRKQAEEAFRASEGKFRALFESSMDGIMLTSPDGGILAANPAACRLLGRSEAEICRGGRAGIVDPTDLRLAGLLEERTRTGRMCGELRLVRADGTCFEAELSSVVFHTPQGERTSTLIRDLTERRQAEAQVRDALAYLGTLFEASPVGLISYDQTGQAQTANEAAARMVGAGVDQLLTQNFRQIKSWQASGMLAAAERALAKQWPERLEAHFTTTFGKEVWLAMQFVPFQRGDAWHLLLLMTDISEQSKVAAQLMLQSAALEAAANAIVITDAHGTIQWANQAFSKNTGYTLAEVVGQNPRVLKSGAHSREFYEGMWKTILGGHVWHGEMHNRRKDGTPLEEEATITPVKDAAGTITHFIAIKQDITEKKTLEKQFLRAQRLEGIGLLAGGIAHDLNNVLAPILMGADMLKMMTDDERIRHQLDNIAQSAQRGAGIVKQVLTFARGIEGERVTLQPKHIIKEMVRMARETFPPNLHFQVNVPNDLWAVIGDPTQLHQVLLNLSVNARDAMPDGGELSFSARNAEVDAKLAQGYPGAKPGPHVVISVQDNGMGIPPEVMERIFEPFFTTKELGKGTGLGLSTVLGIVRSHGGFVTVASEVGKGTTFDAYLPAQPDAAQAAPAARANPIPLGEGETVLVVDDEDDIVQVTRAMLERHGYRVLTATDGTVALTELSQHLTEVKLVITDILMPFMDGVQLIRAVRRLSPSVKIIAASGALGLPGQRDRTDEVLALGVKHVLHKPFPVEQLLRTVHAELHPSA